MHELLNVSNLKVHFAGRAGLVKALFSKNNSVSRAVDGVSFSIKQGEILCLAGESGCGKTTTGKSILRLVEPTDGNIIFQGEDVRGFSRSRLKKFRQDAQIILQDPFESLNPRQTIFNIVIEPLRVNGLAGTMAQQEAVAARALDEGFFAAIPTNSAVASGNASPLPAHWSLIPSWSSPTSQFQCWTCRSAPASLN